MYWKLVPKNIILALLSHFLNNVNSQSTNYEAKAWFTQHAMGHVTIINGHVMVELDVSMIDVGNETLGIPSDCFSDGVYYHIHTEWNHDDMMDKQGQPACGNAMTGGHWDPWFACSTFSDGVDCKNNEGGCIWPSRYIILLLLNHFCFIYFVHVK